ncbi:SGNH/GDSL hydrolase family protein [Burkholderia cenocepacia]|nr:SGNH/GDSL hydrolase family protein [Burkholderia cenocepacia]RQU21066.1 SGNH/GDSL hydrolase family protein [Burkholderia cenocepacia]
MSTNFFQFIGRIAMKGAIVSLLGAMVVSCSGCGGGGDGAGSPATTAQAAVQPVLIEAYGDSTTQGWQVIQGVGQVTPNGEPAELQKMLRDRFDDSVTIANHGVGATQASQLLNGTDGVHARWADQMAASKAQIVTLNFGLNDAYYSVTVSKNPNIIPESPTDFESTMTQLVQIARKNGKLVVIFEPNPTCEDTRAPLMPQYVDALRRVAVAERVPIVNEFDQMKSLSEWPTLLSDCLHPTDHGYLMKAGFELPVVSTLVQAYR